MDVNGNPIYIDSLVYITEQTRKYSDDEIRYWLLRKIVPDYVTSGNELDPDAEYMKDMSRQELLETISVFIHPSYVIKEVDNFILEINKNKNMYQHIPNVDVTLRTINDEPMQITLNPRHSILYLKQKARESPNFENFPVSNMFIFSRTFRHLEDHELVGHNIEFWIYFPYDHENMVLTVYDKNNMGKKIGILPLTRCQDMYPNQQKRLFFKGQEIRPNEYMVKFLRNKSEEEYNHVFVRDVDDVHDVTRKVISGKKTFTIKLSGEETLKDLKQIVFGNQKNEFPKPESERYVFLHGDTTYTNETKIKDTHDIIHAELYYYLIHVQFPDLETRRLLVPRDKKVNDFKDDIKIYKDDYPDLDRDFNVFFNNEYLELDELVLNVLFNESTVVVRFDVRIPVKYTDYTKRIISKQIGDVTVYMEANVGELKKIVGEMLYGSEYSLSEKRFHLAFENSYIEEEHFMGKDESELRNYGNLRGETSDFSLHVYENSLPFNIYLKQFTVKEKVDHRLAKLFNNTESGLLCNFSSDDKIKNAKQKIHKTFYKSHFKNKNVTLPHNQHVVGEWKSDLSDNTLLWTIDKLKNPMQNYAQFLFANPRILEKTSIVIHRPKNKDYKCELTNVPIDATMGDVKNTIVTCINDQKRGPFRLKFGKLKPENFSISKSVSNGVERVFQDSDIFADIIAEDNITNFDHNLIVNLTQEKYATVIIKFENFDVSLMQYHIYNSSILDVAFLKKNVEQHIRAQTLQTFPFFEMFYQDGEKVNTLNSQVGKTTTLVVRPRVFQIILKVEQRDFKIQLFSSYTFYQMLQDLYNANKVDTNKLEDVAFFIKGEENEGEYISNQFADMMYRFNGYSLLEPLTDTYERIGNMVHIQGLVFQNDLEKYPVITMEYKRFDLCVNLSRFGLDDLCFENKKVVQLKTELEKLELSDRFYKLSKVPIDDELVYDKDYDTISYSDLDPISYQDEMFMLYVEPTLLTFTFRIPNVSENIEQKLYITTLLENLQRIDALSFGFEIESLKINFPDTISEVKMGDRTIKFPIHVDLSENRSMRFFDVADLKTLWGIYIFPKDTVIDVYLKLHVVVFVENKDRIEFTINHTDDVNIVKKKIQERYPTWDAKYTQVKNMDEKIVDVKSVPLFNIGDDVNRNKDRYFSLWASKRQMKIKLLVSKDTFDLSVDQDITPAQLKDTISQKFGITVDQLFTLDNQNIEGSRLVHSFQIPSQELVIKINNENLDAQQLNLRAQKYDEGVITAKENKRFQFIEKITKMDNCAPAIYTFLYHPNFKFMKDVLKKHRSRLQTQKSDLVKELENLQAFESQQELEEKYCKIVRDTLRDDMEQTMSIIQFHHLNQSFGDIIESLTFYLPEYNSSIIDIQLEKDKRNIIQLIVNKNPANEKLVIAKVLKSDFVPEISLDSFYRNGVTFQLFGIVKEDVENPTMYDIIMKSYDGESIVSYSYNNTFTRFNLRQFTQLDLAPLLDNRGNVYFIFQT